MKSNQAITVFFIIILIVGFFFIFSEFRKMSKEGTACLSHPFIYGAAKVASQQPNGHMFCSCQITGDEQFYPYSFNEQGENPKPKIDTLQIRNLTEQ